MSTGHAPDIDRLIQLLGKLPGLGPRSARRAVLHLIKKRDPLLVPLAEALATVRDRVRTCSVCGNADTVDPCSLCADPRRATGTLCVVEDVADLWALDRSDLFTGRYHVLGGTLSALDGIGPDDLSIAPLVERVRREGVDEVILALNATVDGQTTAHYVTERLASTGVRVTALAHGLPVGGELDYLDDGTLAAALQARKSL
ncbi:recombination protein RecR [Rhodothalassium salexigens]|uniref:recombination mediator RecR n=1 Tax=Rhodothalassium salexigens TaxID=1086 RepID=UPI0019145DA4|nr:recombination mediator RecR [Rhodothalassium salexigens]MBK5910964.1 recombination protein RecR [Rhodothalassium salexigens]MBK5921257.1 recombination protein RecR [Rhodothalassium salexigens]